MVGDVGLEESKSFLLPLTIEGDGLASVSGASFTLPSGTVTFLLTDVAGSTRAWQQHAEVMPAVIARHYELLDAAITRHGGVRPVEQGEGDSVVGAFARASDALGAAMEAQQGLLAELWPDGISLGVRMAVHTGEAVQRDHGNYVGSAIIAPPGFVRPVIRGRSWCPTRRRRWRRTASPSGASWSILELTAQGSVRDRGHWALVHPDLPVVTEVLRSMDTFRHNLPPQPTPLIGRRDELNSLAGELAVERLVTLTGGAVWARRVRRAARCGADRAVPRRGVVGRSCTDRDPGCRPCGAAGCDRRERGWDAPGGRGGPRPCEPRRADVAGVRQPRAPHSPGCGAVGPVPRRSTLTILATSREPLGLAGEVTWRVPSLALPPRDLRRSRRARSIRRGAPVPRTGSACPPAAAFDRRQAAAVAEICHRLDGIPLAIELAAARCRQLSPERIAAELGDRFRLLTGGAGRCCHVSRPSRPRWNGATSCSTVTNERCCAGWRCSPVRSVTTPPKQWLRHRAISTVGRFLTC